MTDDEFDRLKTMRDPEHNTWGISPAVAVAIRVAVAEIERLRADNERLNRKIEDWTRRATVPDFAPW